MKLPSAGHATGGKRRAAGRQRAAGSGQQAAGKSDRTQTERKQKGAVPKDSPFHYG